MLSVNAGVSFYEAVVRQHKKPRSSKTATEITLGILIMPLRHRLMCKNNREWLLCILTHKTLHRAKVRGDPTHEVSQRQNISVSKVRFIVAADESESFASTLRNSHQFTRLSPGFLRPFNFYTERFASPFINSLTSFSILNLVLHFLSLVKKLLSTHMPHIYSSLWDSNNYKYI